VTAGVGEQFVDGGGHGRLRCTQRVPRGRGGSQRRGSREDEKRARMVGVVAALWPK
jgi:hypothetical protein